MIVQLIIARHRGDRFTIAYEVRIVSAIPLCWTARLALMPEREAGRLAVKAETMAWGHYIIQGFTFEESDEIDRLTQQLANEGITVEVATYGSAPVRWPTAYQISSASHTTEQLEALWKERWTGRNNA
jgi:hypothetical protein